MHAIATQAANMCAALVTGDEIDARKAHMLMALNLRHQSIDEMEELAIDLLHNNGLEISAMPAFLREQMDARRSELLLLQEIAFTPSRLHEYIKLVASNRRSEVCNLQSLLNGAQESPPTNDSSQ